MYIECLLILSALLLQEIIPFIEKHWENMTTMPRRVKHTWHNTVNKTLVSYLLCLIKAAQYRLIPNAL